MEMMRVRLQGEVDAAMNTGAVSSKNTKNNLEGGAPPSKTEFKATLLVNCADRKVESIIEGL